MDIDKLLEESNWSTSTSIEGSSLTLPKLQKMFDLLEESSKTKRIIIFFSSFIDTVLLGSMIDKLLLCSEYEEGFIVPEKYRNDLWQYRNCYVEKDLRSMIVLFNLDFRFKLY